MNYTWLGEQDILGTKIRFYLEVTTGDIYGVWAVNYGFMPSHRRHKWPHTPRCIKSNETH